MRKYILATLICLASMNVSKAQTPELTVDGKTNAGVHLQTLKIDVKVCGTVARTTWEMTFKNTTTRILEGNLNFPLKEGLSVSRYALDINGKLREAVPVERSKGTEVFEAIERRRVDPGLLEKLDGNTFRTRIYPINPNSTRTVVIGYEEELPLNSKSAIQYYLPLNLKDTVADFSLHIAVIQSTVQPMLDSACGDNLHFESQQNFYNASLQKQNYVPNQSLAFSIPKPLDAAEVMLQEFENKYYYLINTRIEQVEQFKKMPSTICLFWDASFSGLHRNIKKELDLLDAYFQKTNNTIVSLVTFSNQVKSMKGYLVSNGNWTELRKALESIVYDGATNLGNLNFKNNLFDEYLLVSDGQQTFGNAQIELGVKKVNCINSAVAADYSQLKWIAQKTAGVLIDLQKEEIIDAIKKLTNEPFRFLGIKQNAFVKENYPSMPVVVNGQIALSGIAEEGIEEITLQFGYGNEVTYEKKVAINTAKQLCENFDITKVYAQKKIAELDMQYNLNKQEIERIGNQFGIVTRNTSLIVLETINDYIQYGIEPPLELRPQYQQIMKQRNTEIYTKKANDLQSSLNMMAVLKGWYDPKPVVTPIVKQRKPEPVEEDESDEEPVIVQAPVRLTPQPIGSIKTFCGSVLDAKGVAIPGATIKIKGTRNASVTDVNGRFQIIARKGDVFVFSSIGFISGEQQFVDTVGLIFTMQASSNYLNEVVVTSLSASRRKSSVAYATSRISADQISGMQEASIEQSLAGKVPGVLVTSNANSGLLSNIKIRGNNTINPNGEVLYVVDGVLQTNQNNVDPDDIEKVEVLKDANATAIYGSKAANGVVVITTKNYRADSIRIVNNATVDSVKRKNVEPTFDVENFDYIRELKLTTKAELYAKYLTLRVHYLKQPTFFFAAGSYFIKTGDKENGITILSNLAEMENSNYELYKMLGYKLKDAGEYEGELSAFNKVKELRPTDPQSFRDCALANLDLGNEQAALDMLYEGMTKSYSEEMNRMYSGIEEIFLTEINRILSLHKTGLNTKNIDKKIIAPMPTDLRVVMNWNKNNTDIDLWVTDPNGEKCFYSHKTTAIGGRISDDFTEGFGPEQFLLKKAIKGKYKIQINYYNDTQVTIAGPTTIMAEIYLHYGTSKEERKIVTLQMEKDKQGEVFVGEVDL